MLLSRSQRASPTGMAISIRTLPSSDRFMRLTWPMGKPEKLIFMPTLTPSAFSVMRMRLWVRSKAPRA